MYVCECVYIYIYICEYNQNGGNIMFKLLGYMAQSKKVEWRAFSIAIRWWSSRSIAIWLVGSGVVIGLSSHHTKSISDKRLLRAKTPCQYNAPLLFPTVGTFAHVVDWENSTEKSINQFIKLIPNEINLLEIKEEKSVTSTFAFSLLLIYGLESYQRTWLVAIIWFWGWFEPLTSIFPKHRL